MKKNKFWLKLIGTAILLHIVLIALSILEVTIYSYLVAPGKDEAFYKAHTQISAPWVSGIGGSVIIFLLIRNFIKKNNDRHLTYIIAFPLTYYRNGYSYAPDFQHQLDRTPSHFLNG